MNKVIEIPIIVCGKLIYPEDEYTEIAYSGGVKVRITKFTDEHAKAIESNREKLHDIPLHEVTGYLSNFAVEFMKEDNPIRLEAIEFACATTGYSKETMARDYFIIAEYVLHRHIPYNLVEAELGDSRILDNWVTNQVARIKAFPRGRAFHVLVGNVPLASMYSIFRSILTKNQTVVKLPSRDLISGLYFMKALIEVNGPEHPISRSLSAFYCSTNDKLLDRVIRSADMVCAWGKGSSLKAIKEKIPHSIPYLEQGPKRSFSFIDLNNCDFDKAAIRIAHDISIYDQEACFCPQRLFVIGDTSKFVKHMQKWLDWQFESLPKGNCSPDSESHLNRVKMEAKYRGWEVFENKNNWSIIIADPYKVSEHPLGRTIFVHQVNSVDDILPFIDDDTQTISIYPYRDDFVRDAANKLCSHGASRICEVGVVNYPREGFTWDGMYPLNYFVRLSYMDENVNTIYKYGRKQDAEWYMHNVYGNPINNEAMEGLVFDEKVHY